MYVLNDRHDIYFFFFILCDKGELIICILVLIHFVVYLTQHNFTDIFVALMFLKLKFKPYIRI